MTTAVSNSTSIPSYGVITPSQLTSSATATDGLGEGAFMQLMLAQMKNQDPLQPMDNTQFIAQLAQFNSLDQLMELNNNLKAAMYMDQFSQAASLVGKNVTSVDPKTGETVSGQVSTVSFEKGIASLEVGDSTIGLENIVTIES